MIRYQTPVRLNTPQKLQYTFQDQSEAPISLTSYVSTWAEVKCQGGVFATLVGTFQSAASGIVKVDAFTFTQVGVWTLQFFCVDGSGNKLFGEPLMLKVAGNVEDAGLNELLLR